MVWPIGSATSTRSGISRLVRPAGVRPAIDDRLHVALRHRQNQIGVAHELFGERLGFVPRQVEALLAHHLHGFGRWRAAGRGGDAGRHDDHAVSSSSSSVHFKRLAKLVAHQQLGHRAAAGVAGANEQHHDAGQPPQRGFADDALAEHLELSCS